MRGRDSLEDLRIDGMIILNRILMKNRECAEGNNLAK